MRTVTRTHHHGEPSNPHRPPRRTDTHACVKPTTLDRMIAQRNRLADKYYQADAHAGIDALDIARLLGATEDAIRNLSRTAYRTLTSRWAEEDAHREHTPDDPRPETCPTCAHHASTGLRPAGA